METAVPQFSVRLFSFRPGSEKSSKAPVTVNRPDVFVVLAARLSCQIPCAATPASSSSPVSTFTRRIVRLSCVSSFSRALKTPSGDRPCSE